MFSAVALKARSIPGYKWNGALWIRVAPWSTGPGMVSSQPPHQRSILVYSLHSSSYKCFPPSMVSGSLPSEQPFLTLFSAAHLTVCPDELLSKRLPPPFILLWVNTHRKCLHLCWFCDVASFILSTVTDTYSKHSNCCVDSDLRVPRDRS